MHDENGNEEDILREELLCEWGKLSNCEKRKWLAALKASNDISNRGENKNAERD